MRNNKSFRARTILFLTLGVLMTSLVLSAFVTVGNSQPAEAATVQSASVNNFNSTGQQITKFDVNGKGIDAHDGDMAYFNGTYYLYGTAYGCGYQLQTNGTPFCGFKSYSSTDMMNWTDRGYLYNASTPAWQASCASPRYGCYRPHVLFNAASNKYVLWINSYDAASGYHVFTAATPTGPFIETAQPTLADMGAAGGFVNGDFGLFADDDGTGYIVYTDINAPLLPGQLDHTLRIQKLDVSYTSGTGPAVSTGTQSVEAPSLTKKDNTYYLIYGPGCAYCGSTPTVYKTAAAVLGTWSAAKQINASSCGGQPSFVRKMPTATGGTTYVYGSDLWHVEGPGLVPNQALANYFWTPLTFDVNGIQPFTCANSVSIPLGPNATLGQPTQPVGLDQTSGSGNFRSWCDISANWSRGQGFTAGRSGKLTTISIDTFQKGRPNAPLYIRVYAVGSNGIPVNPLLYQGAVPPSFISWSPTTYVASPNINVTAGQRYAIVLETASTTGCYGWEYTDANPYAGGVAYYKILGQNWLTENSRDLKFLTVVQ